MKTPDITILLVAYNAEQYISECIKSVLAQTFKTFEFLIIDDGSTDNTVKIIRNFTDSRIRLVYNNHDYIKSLNKGMLLAKGEYIARIDADDKMHPDRIQKQMEIMTTFPNVDVCATWVKTFGNTIRLISGHQGFIKKSLAELLLGNFICHPSTMFRSSFFHEHGITYKNYDCAEDYRLWVDVALHGGVFYIIPYPLTLYRISYDQVSYKQRFQQNAKAQEIRYEILLKIINENNIPSFNEFQTIYKCLEKMNNRHLIGASDVLMFISYLYKQLVCKQ